MSKQPIIDSVILYKYTYGVTLNIPAPAKGCFVLSRANEFATLKEAVDYADAVQAHTNLECIPTATRISRNNGNTLQNIVYKTIIVSEDGTYNPDKVDFWHYPVHSITKEQHAAMDDKERSELRDKYNAAFFDHIL